MSARKTPQTGAAYLLHRYDWSETSLILDLFTRDHGRVTVAAKGAKRPYSQLRPVLLPFQRIQVAVNRPARDPHADVLNLRSAEWAGGGPMLGGAALFAGFYLNELLMKLLARHDPHPRLFDAYAASLPALASGHDPLVQAALRAFEILLLRDIGLLPELDVETGLQAPLNPAGWYALQPEGGVSACGPAEAGRLRGSQLQALQRALDDHAVPALQRACAEFLPPLKPTLRGLLHYHLGSPRMRTRDVMLDARQWADRSVAPEPKAAIR